MTMVRMLVVVVVVVVRFVKAVALDSTGSPCCLMNVSMRCEAKLGNSTQRMVGDCSAEMAKIATINNRARLLC